MDLLRWCFNNQGIVTDKLVTLLDGEAGNTKDLGLVSVGKSVVLQNINVGLIIKIFEVNSIEEVESKMTQLTMINSLADAGVPILTPAIPYVNYLHDGDTIVCATLWPYSMEPTTAPEYELGDCLRKLHEIGTVEYLGLFSTLAEHEHAVERYQSFHNRESFRKAIPKEVAQKAEQLLSDTRSLAIELDKTSTSVIHGNASLKNILIHDGLYLLSDTDTVSNGPFWYDVTKAINELYRVGSGLGVFAEGYRLDNKTLFEAGRYNRLIHAYDVVKIISQYGLSEDSSNRATKILKSEYFM